MRKYLHGKLCLDCIVKYRSLKLVRGPTFFKIVAKNLFLITPIYGVEKL